MQRSCLKSWKSRSHPIVAAAFCALAVMSATAAFGQAQREPAAAPKSSRVAATGEAARPRPADIDRNGVLILVKSVMLALDQANKTGNYSVLRDLGSPSFQVNTAARLAEIFAWQRQQRLDLAGLVVLDPQLTLLPQIEPGGKLHLAGFFPSTPMQVNFELLYEPVNREWRVFAISVSLSAGGPKAPDSPTAEPPQVSQEPPRAPTVAVLPVNPKAGK
ncbi:hypothetical protein MesoLj131a_13110 [Mesorhizobium sp. 131-2-1]|nr:hypothetical protein MesoLj131a_13110 [Mesorhizobium sp. 131-2-1]